MVSQLGWCDEQIDQAVARARAAGARALQPTKVTAAMVSEVGERTQAMKRDDSRTFMGRVRQFDEFINQDKISRRFLFSV